MLGGHIAFGEAYVDGDWSSPDIAAFLTFASLNNDRLSETAGGTRAAQILDRLSHALRSNTLRGSRRNIVAHYDLGNDFYALWLDPSMSYSSAIYATPQTTLEAAQIAKQDRVLALLQPPDAGSALEIGCGWGSLAIRIAERGCHVTALTLSPAQREFAAASIAAQGLSDRIDLCLTDYREASGQYDRIVSIEMFEAVGEAYWPVYFERLRSLLKAGGTAVLQIITIADDHFVAYRSQPDFIQRYVFPGGMLPSAAILRKLVAQAGLTLDAVETFGQSYARTLEEWRARFGAARAEVSALGLSERFHRLWDYYLAYCEAGFRTGAINVLWQLRG
jgi:cyclopropane-fatty-acyl-phospholipid synthase